MSDEGMIDRGLTHVRMRGFRDDGKRHKGIKKLKDKR